jgi:hypothetical protein
MITKQYTCTLLSDIVLNSSLATDGNMSTLDYIPGSNFLGIVASKIYETLDNEKAFSFFHAGDVAFGDATISMEGSFSFPMPLSFFIDKLDKKIGEDSIYLHHLISNQNQPKKEDRKLQLKQLRSGYVLSNQSLVTEIEKSFSLKSGQDRTTRSSKEGSMFGFEAMKKGQVFCFSIHYKEEASVAMIEKALIGTKRLGKSKNAEYGQVEIKQVNESFMIETFENKEYTLVYAQSNLYITDKNGQATLQPEVGQLGLTSGAINWEKSQVRSFSYSPWNSKRKTSSTQRHCIAKGSVFYVENASKPSTKENLVGGFIAEGLGRVIYNPFFLNEGKNKPETISFTKYQPKEKRSIDSIVPSTTLSKYLNSKVIEEKNEQEISQRVAALIYSKEADILSLKSISSSQWGGIRAYATKIKDINTLTNQLFSDKSGYLTHGVAAEKYWDKKGHRTKFEKIVVENKQLGTSFIAKFAAEMAKENKRLENN